MSRKIRVISVLVGLVLMIVSFAGCSKDIGKSLNGGNESETGVYIPDDSLNKIKKAGKLVVGVHAGGTTAYTIIDQEGELMGFNVDVAKYLADGLGVELELVDYEWNGLIPAVLSDKVDIVIANMTITAERASKVAFTSSYFESALSLMINKNFPGIKTWEDIDKEGMIIAVQMGTAGEYAAQRLFKKATVKSFTGSVEIGLSVNTGKVNAAVMDQPWIAVWTMKNSDSVYASPEIITEQKLGIALKQGKPELLQYVNTAIDALRDTSVYDDMYRKWFIDMKWLKEVKAKN
jgi:polar amino acid transport system substrate-binding protein